MRGSPSGWALTSYRENSDNQDRLTHGFSGEYNDQAGTDLGEGSLELNPFGQNVFVVVD